MRLALISDIHANPLALRNVLSAIERDQVDQVVCLGDVATLGPRPKQTLDMLREQGMACILGNHDAFLLDPGLVHTYTNQPVIVQAVDWARARLGQEDLDFLATFRPSIRLALDEGVDLLLFHGSPRSNMDDLLATTPPEDLDRMLAGHQAAVMASGHTHIQMLRQHQGTLLVNPGSVGCPFLEYVAGAPPRVMPCAEYAVVECKQGAVEVSLRRLPLDKKELYRGVEQSEFPLREMMLQQYA